MKLVTIHEGNLLIRFDFDRYTAKQIGAMPHRQFRKDLRAWTLPIEEADKQLPVLTDKLKFQVHPEVYLACQAYDMKRKRIMAMKKAKDAALPNPTTLPLFPYQRAGVNFLLEAGSSLLGDEMGLGKTIQSLALVEQAKAQRVLVVCPSALKYQWQAEIGKFLPWAVTNVIDGLASHRFRQWDVTEANNTLGLPSFTIMNYELLLRFDLERASKIEWDYILADEATRISNPTAKQTKAIKQLKAKHRIPMTGTPVSNHANEIWSLLDFAQPGCLGNYWKFLDRYCVKNHFGAISGYRNIEELSDRIEPMFIRRMKKDVELELPEKITTDVPFKLSTKEHKLYDQMRKELLFEIDKMDISKMGSAIQLQNTLTKMLRLRQLTDSMELLGDSKESTKLGILKELLVDISVENRKTIIFTGFKTMANVLVRELSDYAPLAITGDTPNEERQRIVESFNDPASPHQVLVMTSAGQFGLNIQGASAIIHYDQEWSLAKMEQRDGRAHRYGQKRSVLVYNLLAKGTLDMYVRRVLHKKAQLSSDLLKDNAITLKTVKEALTYAEEN